MKTTEANHASLEFTVESDITKTCILIVVVSSTDTNNISKFALFDSNGNKVTTTDTTGSKQDLEAKGVTGTTFIYFLQPGQTYRFACTGTERVGRLMSIKIAVAQ